MVKAGDNMQKNETVFIIGDVKTAVNNPITQKYNAFYIGLVVNKDNNIIVDADCSTTLELTRQFIKSLFIGASILDVEQVTSKIKNRYFGSSQKALIVAFKNAHLKYMKFVHAASSVK